MKRPIKKDISQFLKDLCYLYKQELIEITEDNLIIKENKLEKVLKWRNKNKILNAINNIVLLIDQWNVLQQLEIEEEPTNVERFLLFKNDISDNDILLFVEIYKRITGQTFSFEIEILRKYMYDAFKNILKFKLSFLEEIKKYYNFKFLETKAKELQKAQILINFITILTIYYLKLKKNNYQFVANPISFLDNYKKHCFLFMEDNDVKKGIKIFISIFNFIKEQVKKEPNKYKFFKVILKIFTNVSYKQDIDKTTKRSKNNNIKNVYKKEVYEEDIKKEFEELDELIKETLKSN